MDDKKTGRRLGCLPLCRGMPVYLNDHINRQQGLVAGTRGVIVDIWFDGAAPTKANRAGDYICEKVPVAVVVKFNGFDAAIPLVA